jgi:hypothetical protein
MRLSTPDADEVFNRFLKRVDSNKLKKNFGVAKEAVTAAESVKNVEKSAFLFFVSETEKKSS